MIISSANVSCHWPRELNVNKTIELQPSPSKSYSFFKVQHHCHLLLEASLTPPPEGTSVLQTAQPLLHILGVYAHILPSSPTKLSASRKRNLCHTCKTASHTRERNVCSKRVLGAQVDEWVDGDGGIRSTYKKMGRWDQGLMKKKEEKKERRERGKRTHGGRMMLACVVGWSGWLNGSVWNRVVKERREGGREGTCTGDG